MSGDPAERARQVKSLIQKARGSLERGRPKEAMTLFLEVLQLEPEHPHVQQWVAKLQNRMKRPAGVGAPALGGGSRAAKLSEETVLSSVRTDVYPKEHGSNGQGKRRAPAKPRPRKPAGESAGGPSKEMDTTVPGLAPPGALDRTAPLTRPAEAAAAPVRRKLAIFGSIAATEGTDPGGAARIPEPPLDMTDPDVQSLMSGSALGSFARRYRTTVILLAAGLVVAICLAMFRSHSQRYRASLGASSTELMIQRGSFFFSGWGDARSVSLGYDAGWQQRMGKPEVIRELRTGKIFDSGPEVDAFVVSLFTHMGHRALDTGNPDTLLEAIYCFKQARKLYERTQPMPAEELPVRKKLVEALLRFSDYRAGRGEKAQAKDSLEQARHYDPSNPEIPLRLTQLSQVPTPVPAPKDSPKPSPKKTPRKGSG